MSTANGENPESASGTLVESKAKKVRKEWKYDPPPVVMDCTKWVKSEEVQLDHYHSDINLVVRAPASRHGFIKFLIINNV